MMKKADYTIVGLNFQPEPTGIAPYTSDLAAYLGQSHSVNVITGFPHYPSGIKDINVDDREFNATHSRVSIRRINHFLPKRLTNIRRVFSEVSFGIGSLFSIKYESKVLILVSPSLLASALVMGASKIRYPKQRVVVWVQDLYSQGIKEISGASQAVVRVFCGIENWLLNISDHVVFVHESFQKNNLLQLKNSSKSTVIRNWSQFEFLPVERPEDTKARYGFNGQTVILHIGNMGVKQGLENVIEAARLAGTRGLSQTFVFVGGGNQELHLRKAAEGADNIKFLGTVSNQELSNILNMADLLLVNEREGVREMSIPSKLTTYFLSGKPILVCSEIDSNAAQEVLKESVGYWTKSGNPEGLADRILSITTSNSDGVGVRAKEYAEEKLSKQNALNSFRALL
jgi:glycosyltransferase involved in cell wall biosynthesis